MYCILYQQPCICALIFPGFIEHKKAIPCYCLIKEQNYSIFFFRPTVFYVSIVQTEITLEFFSRPNGTDIIP